MSEPSVMGPAAHTALLYWRALAGTPERQARDLFLQSALGEARCSRIRCAPNGKPYILPAEEDPCPPHFSLTHTRGLLACAVADVPVGLDAEAADRAVSPLLARRILSEPEQAAYAVLPGEQRSGFLLLSWVVKEAHLKRTGEGVSGNMARLTATADGRIVDGAGNTLSHLAVDRLAGYLVAVACEAPIALRWR
ncbi:MAG: 4'-phosphopantetheinyl transferase family protein [Candidatus Aphodomorpha sp.]